MIRLIAIALIVLAAHHTLAAPANAALLHREERTRAIISYAHKLGHQGWYLLPADLAFTFDTDTGVMDLEKLDIYEWNYGGAIDDIGYSLPPLEVTMRPRPPLWGLPGEAWVSDFGLGGSPFRMFAWFHPNQVNWSFTMYTLDPWGGGGYPMEATSSLLPFGLGNYALRVVPVRIPEPPAWLLMFGLLCLFFTLDHFNMRARRR